MPLIPHFRPIQPGGLKFEIKQQMYYLARAVTPLEVAEALGFGAIKWRGKQNQIRSLMAQMAKSGPLRKVSRGLYANWNDRHTYKVPATFKERLVKYLQAEGPVSSAHLVAHFGDHPAASVRVTLCRLHKEGVVEKVEDGWSCPGNVLPINP